MVERVVIVVDADEDGSEPTEQYFAVLSDGTRIADTRRSVPVGCAGFGFRPRDLVSDKEEVIREIHTHGPARQLDSLVAALRAAGTEVTAEGLHALPLDVEFTDAGRERVENPITPPAEPMTWRHRAIIWIVATVLGAFFPAWRYDAWRRKSLRRRFWGGLAGVVVGSVLKEWARPAPHRPQYGKSRKSPERGSSG